MPRCARHRKTTSPFRVAFRRTALLTLSFLAASSGVGVAQASGLLDDVVEVQAPESSTVTASDAKRDRLAAHIEKLETQHRCSHDGLAPGVIPEHSVVVVDGHARLASFDEGWAIYEGDAPGTLVSVCAR